MSEQEACTDLVERASQDQPSGTIDGESLLLPLLQGLLETPDKEPISDSGTESGEDQRNGLIAEVQSALDKLSASLVTGATDITPERRSSLLELVNKLQAGLSSTTPNLDRQLSGGGSARFNRRKNRRARHTVGVSSEELANARRLMEEISSREPIAVGEVLLQKQSSESSVSSSSPYNKYGSKAVITNATPRPFNSSSNNVSNVSSSVETPTLPGQEETSEQDEEDADTVVENDQNDVVFASLQVNPIYAKPKHAIADDPTSNRFNARSKKLRMKRANTIDIPKPLNFYAAQEDSDNSDSETEAQKRKNEYYALRGPVRVSDPVTERVVPVFEPKTRSDHKFLELIGKNSETIEGEDKPQNRATVWGSKFGSIQKSFERPAKANSAMHFWKTQDDNVSVGPGRHYGPTISRKSARNLQQMFEEKQKQGQRQTFTRPVPVKESVPLPVNQFSHAPQSAFRPISKKTPADTEPVNTILKREIKEDKDNTALYLYSPKPLSQATSPVNPKPWVTNSTEHGGRVLNLVARKFEAPRQRESPPRPRRVSKEMSDVFNPQQSQPEKMSAPYIAKSQNSVIRNLSKQYDNKVENIANSITHRDRPAYGKQSNHFRNSLQLNPVGVPQHFNAPSFGRESKTSGDNNYVISQEIKAIRQPASRPQNLQIHPADNVYTSTLKFTPQPTQPAPKLQTQVSNESLHEYTAISSRVMSGPVSQQAVTVQQKKPMSRDEHDLRAAFDLKSALQSVASKERVFAEKPNKTCGIVKPMQHRPAVNAIYNNISRRESDRVPSINVPRQHSALSKSDSWHQICQARQPAAEPPKSVSRSKSSHSLAVPQKQFEAGITKEELSRKKQTVEAYFSGAKSPELGTKRSINRVKTSEKVSTQQRLSRSRTLPDMVAPQLLDESNVDEAFEDLFMSIS